MATWLVKTEPDVCGYADLERLGSVVWDGVRNHAAKGHLNAMRVGDEVFVYHSQVGLAVVGLARVTKEAFPDPTDPTGRFVAVELAPVRALPQPVALAAMKAEPRLAALPMLRQGRLSVSPVGDAERSVILELGGG